MRVAEFAVVCSVVTLDVPPVFLICIHILYVRVYYLREPVILPAR